MNNIPLHVSTFGVSRYSLPFKKDCGRSVFNILMLLIFFLSKPDIVTWRWDKQTSREDRYPWKLSLTEETAE